MALSARLEFRQSQQLVMTPQLQQAIRLLQFSNMELNAFVDAEVERNPLLERAEEDGDLPLPEGLGAAPAEPDAGGPSDAEEWLDLGGRSDDAAASLDADPASLFPDATATDLGPGLGDSGWASLRQRSHAGDGEADLEAFAAADVSLKDHLLGQLPLALHDAADRLIGQFLIDMVDESGYLTADLAIVSDMLGASAERVEAVLARMQTFDPPGVLARDLAECLALQLKDQNRYDPQIAALLDNLGLLAQHNLPALRRAVGVDMDELLEMVAEIKRLNPKPGLLFGSVEVQPVVPDVIVRAASDGSWHIELNSETLPRVLVNRTYYARVSRSTRASDDKSYLLTCLQSANWLAKSLDQRARTILRVAEEIVRQQDGFFTHGVQHLRPLNLKTVAEAISMHESTISRVTSNKYIATPRGIFELKYFFTSSIAAAGSGEAYSSEAVRHRIRQMVDAETYETVLSDDMIVDRLKADGIDIARRTVAKYRESMRIPSSVQRRREKRLAAGARSVA
ncbi:MAG: RNA polymerase factor sigma-54 [Hyphomicrobiaceae bacterium]|nr:RNA polymerase factor sigma-54 [Hyphomicrobiaceae bacterium]